MVGLHLRTAEGVGLGMDQGAIQGGVSSRQQFDLLANPFAILRLPITASKDDVAAAFDDAMSDGWADDGQLREARRHLLAPKLRLAATVECLPDVQPQQRDLVLSALRDGVPLSDLIALAKDLPEVARASFLSNVAQLRPSSGVLRYFALTQAAIEIQKLQADVDLAFEAAGLPSPSTEAVREAYDQFTRDSVRRLFSSYRDAAAASVDMRRCLQDGLPSATDDQMAAYTSLVNWYLEFAAGPIGDLRREIESTLDTLSGNAVVSETAIGQIEKPLRQWDDLSQPAQLLAQSKGRDDPQARDLFQNIRGFMIKIANEKNASDVALKLSKVCAEVFAELPRAKQQLDEDIVSLQGLVDEQGVRELGAYIDQLRTDLDPLVRELKGGFKAGGIGRAKLLFQVFDTAVKTTKGTAASDLPWFLVRSLALDINNDMGEGAASDALISGMTTHPAFGQASQNMRTAIQNDHRVLRMNAAQARFSRAIEKKDTAQAREELLVMSGLATEESEKRQYQQAIANLDAAKRGSMVRWIFWVVVIVVALIAVASQSNNRNRSPSYSSSRPPAATNNAPAAVPASTTASQAEVKPAAYSTQPFSRGNIRYCEFESARLDAIDEIFGAESNAVINKFNAAVDDYNSRCAEYRYYPSDLTAVRQELAASQTKIDSDARAILQGWRAGY